MESNGVFLFVMIALFCACIGAAADSILFDIAAAASIVWAHVVYYTEVNDNEDI